MKYKIQNTKYKILFLILFLSVFGLAQNSYAAPSVNGLVGTVNHGNPITISGTGFGEKATAAPLLWDDFESGEAGLTLHASPSSTRWFWDHGSTSLPGGLYSTSQHYGAGSQSAFMQVDEGANNHTYANLGNQTKIYASYRFYHPSGTSSTNMKFSRLSYGVDVHGAPYMGYTGTGSSYWYWVAVYGDPLITPVGTEGSIYAVTPKNIWTRDDYYWEASTVDVADGKVGMWRDLELWNLDEAAMTVKTGGGSFINTYFLPYYSMTIADAVYVDDVYIDNTLSRVEICNAATKATSNHCEIQIPQNIWNDGQIQIKVNQGSFADNSVVYLYVIDSNGTANASGKEITFGSSGGDVTAPSTPSGLSVN